MTGTRHDPWIVERTLQIEQTTKLDGVVRTLEPHVRTLFGSGVRGRVLRGGWLGHAIHPMLTDVVLGTWTSATLLDALGGPKSAPAAKTLIGVGLAAAGPTAWTGWAEWSGSGVRDQRVGLVHAATNGAAISLYAASWVARHRDRHRMGTRLALAGTAVSGLGAYLGGHLVAARKVASHHPAYSASARPTEGQQ